MISSSSDQAANAQGPTTQFRPGRAVLQGRFTLRELLEAEEPGCGAPAVWLVDGPGASFIAKLWEKRIDDDTAIKAIWNHEVRSLLRLNGLPLAPEYFANLEALGADDQGYYVIVDGGGRHLLSEVLAARNQHHGCGVSISRGSGRSSGKACIDWRPLWSCCMTKGFSIATSPKPTSLPTPSAIATSG